MAARIESGIIGQDLERRVGSGVRFILLALLECVIKAYEIEICPQCQGPLV